MFEFSGFAFCFLFLFCSVLSSLCGARARVCVCPRARSQACVCVRARARVCECVRVCARARTDGEDDVTTSLGVAD